MDALREKYRICCDLLGVERGFSTTPQHNGEAHIEIVAGMYHYVMTERGTETERCITGEEDEILYWLMSDVVFDLATRYACEHRVRGVSFRRLLFAREMELMGKLSPHWQQRKRREIEAILDRHPYDDVAEG